MTETADQAFFAALTSADAERLDALLTDDFILVDVLAGGVVARDALLDAVRSGALAFEAIEPAGPPTVRTYGATTIVVGETRMRGRAGSDRFAAHSRYTHVFVERDGRPALATAQGTPIAGS